MKHAFMYQGAFETNHASLQPGATTYRTHAGETVAVPAWPQDASGIRVAYMEKRGKRFFVVRIQFEDHDVVLRAPIVIDSLRHLGGRRLSADPTLVSDDLASALLDDIIAANPDQTRELALLINRVNVVRRAGARP